MWLWVYIIIWYTIQHTAVLIIFRLKLIILTHSTAEMMATEEGGIPTTTTTTTTTTTEWFQEHYDNFTDLCCSSFKKFFFVTFSPFLLLWCVRLLEFSLVVSFEHMQVSGAILWLRMRISIFKHCFFSSDFKLRHLYYWGYGNNVSMYVAIVTTSMSSWHCYCQGLPGSFYRSMTVIRDCRPTQQVKRFGLWGSH